MATDRTDALESGTPSSGRKGPIRALSAGLFVVLVAATVALAATSRQVLDDQEQRLLEQRAAEVIALLTLSGQGLQEALRTASTVVALTGADGAAFSSIAKVSLANQTFDGVAVVQPDGTGYRVVQSEGPGFEAGTIGEPVAGLLQRVQPDTFVSTPVFERDGQRRIGHALLVPDLNPRTLVYAESVILPPNPRATRPNDPFSDLDGAVYAGARTDPAQLVVVSDGFEPGSGALHRTWQLGGDTWLVELSPKGSLVGSLASRQPWLYLAVGLILAVLVSALVEILLRRRHFVLGVVEQRTAELRQSLAELDATHRRLVTSERLAAIGQLASAVGHELRNPLGVLSNLFYLLGQRLGRDDPWVDRQLATGEREVAAATLIVSDLLEYSKPRQPVHESIEIEPFVDEVLSVAPPPGGVEVGLRLAPGVPPLRADRQQLRQVLLNLVCNAYDAMPDGGLLIIEADWDGDTLRLAVSDTGGGIPDDVLPRLFEPFFTTKAKGIGLGLSVAHRIVDAHGGSLDATTRPGTGASFVLTLSTSSVPAATFA